MAEPVALKIAPWPSVAADKDGPRPQGARCRDCGKTWFPGAAICPQCRSQAIEPVGLSRGGKLYSWSRLHQAARGWAAPYVVGYVDLPEGVRVFTHIATDDPNALKPDQPMAFRAVTPVTNSEGQEVIHFVFVPEAKHA